MKKMVRCLRSLLTVGWLLAALSVTAEAAPTAAEITGEIERLTLNNPADVYSGGVMIVGGSQVILPKNLLIDLPANRLPLQQIFAQAPAACKANGESGLAKADKCNASGTGGFATLSGVHSTAGNIIAGDVLIVLDDTWLEPGGYAGKGSTAVPMLLERGYAIVGQTRTAVALQRPEATGA